LNSAIYDFLANNDEAGSFQSIFYKWFGNATLNKMQNTCVPGDWPALTEFEGTMKNIQDRGYILVGAPIPPGGNIPKRFNFTAVGVTQMNDTYGTLSGLEADIASSLANRIAQHYAFSGGLVAYWINAAWDVSPTENIIISLNEGHFDMILASMTINATWAVNSTTQVPRTDLIDFTCPYESDGDAAVLGQKPLPNGVVITDEESLNAVGLIVCVEIGTTGEQYANSFLTNTTILHLGGTDIRSCTINQTCHLYISPFVNAAQDASSDPGQLKFLFQVGPQRPFGIGLRKDIVTSPTSASTSTSSTGGIITSGKPSTNNSTKIASISTILIFLFAVIL